MGLLYGLMVMVGHLATSDPAGAQNYEAIQWTSVSDPAGFSYAAPKEWRHKRDRGFTTVMQAPEEDAYCTLKRTVDSSFAFMSDKLYTDMLIASPERLEASLPLQYPDGSGTLISIQEFPFGMNTGVLITTSGNDNGVPLISSVFQTVEAGAVYTLGCFTRPSDHGYFFPIFARIVGTFQFSGD